MPVRTAGKFGSRDAAASRWIGEPQRGHRLGEHEHERVADLLDERAVVLVDEPPDEPVEAIEDVRRDLVAVHARERRERREVDEADRRFELAALAALLGRLEVGERLLDR